MEESWPSNLRLFSGCREDGDIVSKWVMIHVRWIHLLSSTLSAESFRREYMQEAKCKEGHINIVKDYESQCPTCGGDLASMERVPRCRHHTIFMKRGLKIFGMEFNTFECQTCVNQIQRWLEEHGLMVKMVGKVEISGEVPCSKEVKKDE